MNAPTLRACPGNCGRQIVRGRLLCARCWYALDDSTRFRVSRCWQLLRRRNMSRADYLDVAAIAVREARRRNGPRQMELAL